MISRLQRRMLAPLALGAVAVLGLTGCGTATTAQSTELTDEDVTLTLSWWGADARGQKTSEAIKLFEKAHPNITVEAQNSDWGGYWDRLATTTAAGDMPDVMQFDEQFLASYANRGTLLDLAEFTDILDPSYMDKKILAGGAVNDTQYAIPISGAPSAVLINTALFEQYGVSLPDLTTWTWDDYSETAQALTEASDGAVHGISPVGVDSFTLNVFARQHGEQLFDEDGDIVIPVETVADYWQTELDQIESGAAPSAEQLSESAGVPLDQYDIVTGKTAMQFIPAGVFTAHQSAAPNAKFILADWPTDSDTEEGFQYMKPTMYWSAAATSAHPAEAAALIDFLTTDPEVGTLFGTDRGISVNPDIQEVIKPTLTGADKIAFDYITNAAETVGAAAPITPNGASDINAVISRYNQEVQFKSSTPTEAAEAMIAEIQNSIDAAK
ncbi:extracellular solute-binding protein [Cryobacterium lactosi]|uniref:Extracellular solute-binding protein n=2 Tax=Cryobacterium lactosi TaxID=1259202 RepID=A0A4R9BX53_9MICO|nr:extracellular solute-binding protein [Cryobacterium lactosi]